MKNKSKADILSELKPDGIFDLCDHFPVNDKEVSFEEYFWIENYILSPNQQYIAIFVRRNESKVGNHYHHEYIIIIGSLINNKIVYFGEYIEKNLDIEDYCFSYDSKYLIYHQPKKLVFINISGNENNKRKKIESQFILSCDSKGNINLLINDLTVATIQIENDYQQITQFKFEVSFYQILFSKYAYVESYNKTYIIQIETQKILLTWINNQYGIRYFQKAFVVQGQPECNTLRNLQTGKIIRNINLKLGLRQTFQDQESIYLFQIVKNVAQKKFYKQKNKFSRFDILRGVYKQLNINITPFNDQQIFNNDLYIDVQEVEDVDFDQDKIKKLRYFHITNLTK